MLNRRSLLATLNEQGILGTLRRAPLYLLGQAVDEFNRLWPSGTYMPPTNVDAYREIQQRARTPMDISDHLPRLFIEALQANPETIVELGVRGGESTFAFERAARLTDATVVSVDINETSYTSEYDNWQFVQANDLELADRFEEWCGDHAVNPAIDVLFVDTSHHYDHTVAEIEGWFPHLSADGIVLFHDTNMAEFYRRGDGTIGQGWDNDRGVIRALEDYFDCGFDESEPFVTVQSGFVIRHYPLCSGLTVLQKLDSAVT